MAKNPPAMWETLVRSLGWEDPLGKSMATHSSFLGWQIPMDRGAWWATVHGGTKSRTRLSDFPPSFPGQSFSGLEMYLLLLRTALIYLLTGFSIFIPFSFLSHLHLFKNYQPFWVCVRYPTLFAFPVPDIENLFSICDSSMSVLSLSKY